jgi:hypothetical protein
MLPRKRKPQIGDRGCRLVWSRLVASGAIDPGSNPGSPISYMGSVLGWVWGRGTLNSASRLIFPAKYTQVRLGESSNLYRATSNPSQDDFQTLVCVN